MEKYSFIQKWKYSHSNPFTKKLAVILNNKYEFDMFERFIKNNKLEMTDVKRIYNFENIVNYGLILFSGRTYSKKDDFYYCVSDTSDYEIVEFKSLAFISTKSTKSKIVRK